MRPRVRERRALGGVELGEALHLIWGHTPCINDQAENGPGPLKSGNVYVPVIRNQFPRRHLPNYAKQVGEGAPQRSCARLFHQHGQFDGMSLE